MQYPFEIPCLHETADPPVPRSSTVHDYYPLSRREIKELLAFARDHKGDVVALAMVQVRLNQGIPGMLCPRFLDNAAGKKMVEMEQLLAAQSQWETPGLVKALEALMRA